MRFTKAIVILLFTASATHAQNVDSTRIKQLFSESLSSGRAYEMLRDMCTNIGPRLSGSPNAEKAVQWGKLQMQNMLFDSVWLQPVMVPHSVRGNKEKAYIQKGDKKIVVPVCALGNSVGTPKGGITAQIIEIKNVDELKKISADKVKGKLVFLNQKMDETVIMPFNAYDPAVGGRVIGAVEAAKKGAIGLVIRSVTNVLDDNPHTGTLRYVDTVAKIPACAISTKAANILSEMLSRNPLPQVKFYFEQNCEMLPDVQSYNVVGQINGTDLRNELVICGGHLDSWDLAQGAHDDGAGVVQCMDALRLIKNLGVRPRRSIRCVLFMNEENGLRGGLKYAELAKANNEKHIAAIESDEGGFAPRGFGIEGTEANFKALTQWKTLLAPYGLLDIHKGGGGADIGPLKDQGVPLIGFIPDPQRYFDFHHTPADTFDAVNRRELQLGAASVASLMYLIAQYGLQ